MECAWVVGKKLRSNLHQWLGFEGSNGSTSVLMGVRGTFGLAEERYSERV